MKLYIAQRVFSWNDSFDIKDENGNVVYTAKGSVLKIGKELEVKDKGGKEVIYVRQKLISLMPQYYLTVNGKEIGKLEKKIALLSKKYRVDDLDWDVSGDFTGHSYEIEKNGKAIASMAKKWVSWGDAYELDVKNAGDELAALAVILAIDCEMDDD